MDEVASPEFLDTVNRRAGQLRQGLESLVASHPAVFEEVRGSGLMLGLKCKVANPDVLNAAYAAELITVPAADNVIRLLPPLNISEEEVSGALARLERVAQSLDA